jgi:hypothetical protein
MKLIGNFVSKSMRSDKGLILRNFVQKRLILFLPVMQKPVILFSKIIGGLAGFSILNLQI